MFQPVLSTVNSPQENSPYQQFLPSSLDIEWRYAHIVDCSGFSNKPSRTVEQHTSQYSSHQYLRQWRCPLSLWHALNKTVGNSYAEKSNVSDPLGISFHGVQWYLISPRHCLIIRIPSSSESARTGTEKQGRKGLYKIEVLFFFFFYFNSCC